MPRKVRKSQISKPIDTQVGGKKELTGRTDIEIEISNQCARLITNAKALALIKKMSPAAWCHIHLNGHYIFRGNGQIIYLDAIVAGLELG
jgi:hypothetical protein